LEKDLLVIAEGVKVGRRTFENTMKYVRITISASFGNVISMALASFFLPFLPMLPTQILLLNFLSDLPAIAISSDRVDEEDLEHARRWTMREIARFMVFFGVISSIFDLLVFFISLNLLHAEAPELRSTWFACSLWTEVIAIVVLRTRRRSWQSIPSKPLLALSIFVIVIAMSVPLFGIFRAFDLPQVALPFTAQVVLLSAFYAALTEIGKHRTRFFV
jgi:P-type Mg2+ transporter